MATSSTCPSIIRRAITKATSPGVLPWPAMTVSRKRPKASASWPGRIRPRLIRTINASTSLDRSGGSDGMSRTMDRIW
jgi:hypothetical protein